MSAQPHFVLRLTRHMPTKMSWTKLKLGNILRLGLLGGTLGFMADKRGSQVSKLKRKRPSKEENFSEHRKLSVEARDPGMMADHEAWGNYGKL